MTAVAYPAWKPDLPRYLTDPDYCRAVEALAGRLGFGAQVETIAVELDEHGAPVLSGQTRDDGHGVPLPAGATRPAAVHLDPLEVLP